MTNEICPITGAKKVETLEPSKSKKEYKSVCPQATHPKPRKVNTPPKIACFLFFKSAT